MRQSLRKAQPWIRKAAIRQELLPSQQPLNKPTRDISASIKSQSLSRDELPPPVLQAGSQKRIFFYERDPSQIQYQKQANIIYNDQFKTLAKLLGNEKMEFEQLRQKIQNLILQGGYEDRTVLLQKIQILQRQLAKKTYNVDLLPRSVGTSYSQQYVRGLEQQLQKRSKIMDFSDYVHKQVLQQAIKTLQEQLGKKESQIRSLETQNYDSKLKIVNKVTIVQQQLVKKNQTIQKLSFELNTNKLKTQTLAQENERIKKREKELQTSLEVQTRVNYGQTTYSLNSIVLQLQNRDQQIRQYHQQAAEMQRQLSQIKGELDNAENRYKRHLITSNQMQESLGFYQNLSKNLQNDLDKMNHISELQQERLRQLQHQRSEHIRSITEQITRQNQQLREEIQQAISQKQQILQQCHQIQDKHQQLVRMYEQIGIDYRKITIEKEEITLLLQTAKNKQQELQNEIRIEQRSKRQFQSQKQIAVDNYTIQIDRLQHLNRNLQQDLQKIRQEYAKQQHQILADHRNIQQQLQDQQHKNKKLEDEIQQIFTDKQNILNQRNSMERKIVEMGYQCEELQSQLKNYIQKWNVERAQMSDQIKQAERRKTQDSHKITQMEIAYLQQIQKVKNLHSDEQNDKIKLQKQLGDHQDMIAQLENQLQQIKNQKQTDQLACLPLNHHDTNQHLQQLQNLQQKITHMQQMLQQYRQNALDDRQKLLEKQQIISHYQQMQEKLVKLSYSLSASYNNGQSLQSRSAQRLGLQAIQRDLNDMSRQIMSLRQELFQAQNNSNRLVYELNSKQAKIKQLLQNAANQQLTILNLNTKLRSIQQRQLVQNKQQKNVSQQNFMLKEQHQQLRQEMIKLKEQLIISREEIIQLREQLSITCKQLNRQNQGNNHALSRLSKKSNAEESQNEQSKQPSSDGELSRKILDPSKISGQQSRFIHLAFQSSKINGIRQSDIKHQVIVDHKIIEERIEITQQRHEHSSISKQQQGQISSSHPNTNSKKDINSSQKIISAEELKENKIQKQSKKNQNKNYDSISVNQSAAKVQTDKRQYLPQQSSRKKLEDERIGIQRSPSQFVMPDTPKAPTFSFSPSFSPFQRSNHHFAPPVYTSKTVIPESRHESSHSQSGSKTKIKFTYQQASDKSIEIAKDFDSKNSRISKISQISQPRRSEHSFQSISPVPQKQVNSKISDQFAPSNKEESKIQPSNLVIQPRFSLENQPVTRIESQTVVRVDNQRPSKIQNQSILRADNLHASQASKAVADKRFSIIDKLPAPTIEQKLLNRIESHSHIVNTVNVPSSNQHMNVFETFQAFSNANTQYYLPKPVQDVKRHTVQLPISPQTQRLGTDSLHKNTIKASFIEQAPIKQVTQLDKRSIQAQTIVPVSPKMTMRNVVSVNRISKKQQKPLESLAIDNRMIADDLSESRDSGIDMLLNEWEAPCCRNKP